MVQHSARFWWSVFQTIIIVETVFSLFQATNSRGKRSRTASRPASHQSVATRSLSKDPYPRTRLHLPPERVLIRTAQSASEVAKRVMHTSRPLWTLFSICYISVVVPHLHLIKIVRSGGRGICAKFHFRHISSDTSFFIFHDSLHF